MRALFSQHKSSFYYFPQIVQIEAESLYNEFFKLETALLLEFWSTVLHRSKSLQLSWIDLNTSVSLYNSLASYIQNLRSEKTFNNFVDEAKVLISTLSEWDTKNPELSYMLQLL